MAERPSDRWRRMLLKQQLCELCEAGFSAFTVDGVFHGSGRTGELIDDTIDYFERPDADLDRAEAFYHAAEASVITNRLSGPHGLPIEPGLIGWGRLR